MISVVQLITSARKKLERNFNDNADVVVSVTNMFVFFCINCAFTH